MQRIPDNPGQPQRLAYKIGEAASLLGVTEITVRRLIQRGLIRVNRSLRHPLVPASELIRFLEGGGR